MTWSQRSAIGEGKGCALVTPLHSTDLGSLSWGRRRLTHGCFARLLQHRNSRGGPHPRNRETASCAACVKW